MHHPLFRTSLPPCDARCRVPTVLGTFFLPAPVCAVKNERGAAWAPATAFKSVATRLDLLWNWVPSPRKNRRGVGGANVPARSSLLAGCVEGCVVSAGECGTSSSRVCVAPFALLCGVRVNDRGVEEPQHPLAAAQPAETVEGPPTRRVPRLCPTQQGGVSNGGQANSSWTVGASRRPNAGQAERLCGLLVIPP